MAVKKRSIVTTSISFADSTAYETIHKAAEMLGESVSKFMVTAANTAALKALNGACPGCGRSMKGAKVA